MKANSIVPRLLLCPLAGIVFLLVTSLTRLLGGLFTETRPVINWITMPDQLPMPVTLIVFLFLLVIGSKAGMLVMGVGCTIGAIVGGWAINLPADYSSGWPMNYRGRYIDGAMVELAVGLGSVLLAAAVQLLITWLRRKRTQ